MRGWVAMGVAALSAVMLGTTAQRVMIASGPVADTYGSLSAIDASPVALAPTIIDDIPGGNSAPAEEDIGSLRGTDDAEMQARAITELKADGSGHFITRAEIEGATILVMVDTGASAVALSYEDADAAGLRPHSLDYDVPVATANGITQAARVTLRRVEVEGVLVRNVDGLVLPEGAMRGTLLGMSFLSRLSSFKVEGGTLTLEQ